MGDNSCDRKKNVVQPLFVKMNALEELKNGIGEKTIATDLNVHVNTIRLWKKQKTEILKFTNEFEGDVLKKRKKPHKPKNDIVETAVWEWFKARRKSGVPLSGAQIKMQALSFHKQLVGNLENFSASNGWLEKFKKRHNIRCITVTGEKNSADKNVAENFVYTFNSYIVSENLSQHQIFNCDETGLNYKSMPNSTLASKFEISAPGFKEKRERVTVMACSNVAGSLKLPLVVIGKSAKPRCIKSIMSSDTFPVYYCSQKSAWMVGTIFTKWFHNEFTPRVSQFLEAMNLPIKAVLFVDNCSSHPKELLEEVNIKMCYLSPNTTALIQPMDQGILQCLKLKYRQKLMQHIIDNVHADNDVIEIMKNIDLRRVIYWIADSWNELSPTTIMKAWKPLMPHLIVDENDTSQPIDSETINNVASVFLSLVQNCFLYQYISMANLQDWLHPPTIMTPEETLTNEEFMEVMQHEQREVKNCDENSNENHDDFQEESLNAHKTDMIGDILSKSFVSDEEAKDSLKKLIQYCEEKSIPYLTEKLQDLREIADYINDSFEKV